MGQGHHHHVDPASGDRRVLAAIGVDLALTVAQVVAGVVSGSLAMIADAIHNLSDALSLVIAFAARRIARRPSNEAMTFGCGRAEMAAALMNYTTRVVIALYLIWEGVARLIDPQPVEGWIVVVVAGVALVVDAATAALTYAMARGSANIRAAFLHNVVDALGSIGVIVAGTLILLHGWWIVDPLVTLAIAGYVLWQSVLGAGPVIRMLMLGSPEGLDTCEVLAGMSSVPGVASVHHLHLWEMQEGRAAVDAHVVVEDGHALAELRDRVRRWLGEGVGVGHSTLEMETREGSCCDARAIGH